MIRKIKSLLKDVTKSKNYEVIETSGGSIEVIFHTQNTFFL